LNKRDCDLEKDKIPYKEDAFSLVIYTEVIEHLGKNYLGSLMEIYRVIKPGGFLLFGTPNSKSPWKLFKKKRTSVHIKEFSMSECVSMLRAAGFNVIFNRFMLYLDYAKKHPFDYTKAEPAHFLYYNVVKCIPVFRESILILAKK
jgi:SAM-dependent methyltransferase